MALVSQPSQPALRLVHDEPDPRLEGTWDGPLPTARPADRCERWSVDGAARQALAEGSAARGVDFSLAGALVLERSLIAGDLARIGHADAAAALDAAAVSARVRFALSEPACVYLRALSARSQGARGGHGHICVPMRLTERVSAHGVELLLNVELLDSALLWERAAVLCGRTMGEWAIGETCSPGLD
jgi:hypothetical protein